MNTKPTPPLSPLGSPSCSALPPVLDACCGSKSFWFDKADQRAIFTDRRTLNEQVDNRPGRQPLIVSPDLEADFTNLPFPDEAFSMVVLDPPHIVREKPSGYITKYYGALDRTWPEMLRSGFAECFRVLKDGGFLVFKWNEVEIPLTRILALTPEKPLFGHKSGKTNQTHWVCFMKQNA